MVEGGREGRVFVIFIFFVAAARWVNSLLVASRFDRCFATGLCFVGDWVALGGFCPDWIDSIRLVD